MCACYAHHCVPMGRKGYLSETSLHIVGKTRGGTGVGGTSFYPKPVSSQARSKISVMMRCAGAGERGLPGGAADRVAG